MIITVEIRVENTFDVEIPDGLTEDEAYDYLYENCQDDIDDAINGGDFDMFILNDLDQTEDGEEE